VSLLGYGISGEQWDKATFKIIGSSADGFPFIQTFGKSVIPDSRKSKDVSKSGGWALPVILASILVVVVALIVVFFFVVKNNKSRTSDYITPDDGEKVEATLDASDSKL
jgi:hypothetical protein